MEFLKDHARCQKSASEILFLMRDSVLNCHEEKNYIRNKCRKVRLLNREDLPDERDQNVPKQPKKGKGMLLAGQHPQQVAGKGMAMAGALPSGGGQQPPGGLPPGSSSSVPPGQQQQQFVPPPPGTPPGLVLQGIMNAKKRVPLEQFVEPSEELLEDCPLTWKNKGQSLIEDLLQWACFQNSGMARIFVASAISRALISIAGSKPGQFRGLNRTTYSGGSGFKTAVHDAIWYGTEGGAGLPLYRTVYSLLNETPCFHQLSQTGPPGAGYSSFRGMSAYQMFFTGRNMRDRADYDFAKILRTNFHQVLSHIIVIVYTGAMCFIREVMFAQKLLWTDCN